MRLGYLRLKFILAEEKYGPTTTIAKYNAKMIKIFWNIMDYLKIIDLKHEMEWRYEVLVKSYKEEHPEGLEDLLDPEKDPFIELLPVDVSELKLAHWKGHKEL